MFYQLVSFTFPEDITKEARSSFEDALRALPGKIRELEEVRVIRAYDDVNVTGYVSVFESEENYKRYLEHPEHAPIGVLAESVCLDIRRLLLDDDTPSILPPEQQEEPLSHLA
ncbi:Dabb family protein [Paenarthrobacter sp. Y-19]|uniref:Dabb family protein n=1 Tax=Paenarthrobacter sp. Y-19 TaxID=3031125 RepID=UPI0023DA6D98|nr:Dabb family protein [Paenarthrobacter sp. Y-19]